MMAWRNGSVMDLIPGGNGVKNEPHVLLKGQ